jgi:hypothetical protein
MPVADLINEVRPWLEKKDLWQEAYLEEKRIGC